MRDQLARFCDPSPEFHVDYPTDSAGRQFVVIRIAPFHDLGILFSIRRANDKFYLLHKNA